MKINILPRLAQTKVINKAVNWALKEKTVTKNNVTTKITNYSKMQATFPNCFMVFVQALQCYFLNKSEEMPKERKIPLILNNTYSCTLALTTGLIFKNPIQKMTAKIIHQAETVYANNPHKTNLINGIKTGIPFLTAAVLFQYIGPVIATPLSTQTTKWLAKKGYIDLSKSKKSNK